MSSDEEYAFQDGFAKVHLGKTPRQLAQMGDSELAVWQSNYSYGTPQFSMAEREWQRRLVVEQVKATLSAGRLGVIGSISAAFIGVVLGYFLGTPSSKDQSQPLASPPIVQGTKAVQVPVHGGQGKKQEGGKNEKL